MQKQIDARGDAVKLTPPEVLTYKREGMTNSMAIQLAARDIGVDIAELAGSAPDGTTPDEFRLAVVQSCLNRAAE